MPRILNDPVEDAMLKWFAIIGLLAVTPAIAQQASTAPSDSIISAYAQLLGEANSRVAALSGQMQQANAKIADLQKQIDAAKPKSEPTPAATDPTK